MLILTLLRSTPDCSGTGRADCEEKENAETKNETLNDIAKDKKNNYLIRFYSDTCVIIDYALDSNQ